MISIIKRWAGPAVTFIAALGFQVSGIQNIWLAIGLWILASVWALVAFLTWLPIGRRLTFYKGNQSAQQDNLRIEVKGYHFLESYPSLPYSVLGEQKILEIEVRFYPKDNIRLRSLELRVGKSTFAPTRLPVLMIDREETYFIDFEVPIRWFRTEPKKAYIWALAGDQDWRSNEFKIATSQQKT